MNTIQGKLGPFFSAVGVPLLGLGALVLCLGHPQVSLQPETEPGTMVFLMDPDPRLDKSLAICLRQEAKEVSRCRHGGRPGSLAEAVADYNLVARECTPAVFQTTGLPPSLAQ